MPYDLQRDVVAVGRDVFGDASMDDARERAFRFLEEALELVQVLGVLPAEIHTFARHVYDRPPGDIRQELGGTVVTLYALADALGYRLDVEGHVEINRVAMNKDEIRAKAATKPAAIFNTRPIAA